MTRASLVPEDRCCALHPHSNPRSIAIIDDAWYDARRPRDREITDTDIALWRWNKVQGIYDRFERRNDCLIEAHKISQLLSLTVPGLSYDHVLKRFVHSAKHGLFGWRWYGPKRRTVKELLDLEGCLRTDARFERGHYPLRPFITMVESYPAQMLSRRSIWCAWIHAIGWEIPLELRDSILIEGTAAAFPSLATLPSGIRSNHEAGAEEACFEYLKGLTNRPRNKSEAFKNAVDAVSGMGQLSLKAFDRAWARAAPAEWKTGGRRPKEIDRS